MRLAMTGAIVAAALAAAQEKKGGSMAQDPATPPVYFVLCHSPGAKWDANRSFQEQPGIGEHVAYMAGLLKKGLIVMGGPFLDNSGGMMVSRFGTIEEARKAADDDPGVKAGLLNVVVRPWMVPMSSVK